MKRWLKETNVSWLSGWGAREQPHLGGCQGRGATAATSLGVWDSPPWRTIRMARQRWVSERPLINAVAPSWNSSCRVASAETSLATSSFCQRPYQAQSALTQPFRFEIMWAFAKTARDTAQIRAGSRLLPVSLKNI